MSVSLLFPPAVDPRAPHLAIPSLAAYLRGHGIEVTVRDLNIEGLVSIASREHLIAAVDAAERRLRVDELSSDERSKLRQILARSTVVVENVESALSALRNPDTFFDPNRHHEARNILRYATTLASAATGRVSYQLSNAAYEVTGVDLSSIDQIVAATDDDACNLFLPYWEKTLLPDLLAARPTVVGISILNGQQIFPGLALARLLRRHGFFVAIGGTVYSKFAAEVAACRQLFDIFCDAVIVYEGEAALAGLVAALEGDGDLAKVPNLITRDRAGRPLAGPVRVENVDSLPTPDFEGLPLHQYLSPYPVLPIMTGKGCYFNRCKFCDIPSINSVSRKAYRQRDVDLVVEDVVTLNRRFNARHFVITDEALSPKLLLKLAEAVDRSPHAKACRPRFVGYARLEPGFTREACERLHAMGVRKLFFGLESASQTTLDHLDKGIRVETSVDVLRNCDASGIAVHVFSMIGLPEEPETSARSTLQYFIDNEELLAHPRHSFDVHRFGLDLRTAYFDDAESYGIVLDRAALEAADFPISVKHWQNGAGLAAADVDRLLAEFEITLRDVYRGGRIYPETHWPGFEEYAVLYGDRYEGGFPFRTALPAAESTVTSRLCWSPSVRFGDLVAGERLVWGIGGSIVLGDLAVSALEHLPDAYLTAHEWVALFAGRIPHAPDDDEALEIELRGVLDALLAARLLWYVPYQAAPAQAKSERSGARRTKPQRFRLRPDARFEVAYEDTTIFGSPIGERLDRNVRRLLRPFAQAARDNGVAVAIARGDTILREVLSSEAFDAIAVRVGNAGWNIRPDHLYPDVSGTRPVGLTVYDPRSRATSLLGVDASEWPFVGEVIGGLESPTGLSLESGARSALLHAFRAKGLLEPVEDRPRPGDLSTSDLVFVGHNTVVARPGEARIIVDPFFLPAETSAAYAPLSVDALGKIDAILITHSHPDHFDPGSLLRLGTDTMVIVPDVPRESMLAVDMEYRLRELGFSRVVRVRWGEDVRVMDVEVGVLPFYGEQPTSGAVVHPEVRNHGAVYAVRGPRFSAAFVADSGGDHLGHVLNVAKAWRASHGAVDVVFAGYRGWATYPAQLAFSSVPRYVLFAPTAEWPVRQKLMNDAVDAVDLAEAWGASVLVPYGAGGAPWYSQRGLGPRFERDAIDDPSFDPHPERVVDAAAQRLWVAGSGWMRSRVDVRILRPGDGVSNVTGDWQVRTIPGSAWPLLPEPAVNAARSTQEASR